jgi:PAS domain S-box-containing protein
MRRVKSDSVNEPAAKNEWLRLAEEAAGVGAFEIDLTSQTILGGPQAAMLFGLDGSSPPRDLAAWRQAIFPDDLPKLDAAVDRCSDNESCAAEFRVRDLEGRLQWRAMRARVIPDQGTRVLRGTFSDIAERKQLEARLLAVNETLEARVGELRAEARALEVLNRTGAGLSAERDLQRLVQSVTDAGVELSGASFGAFFYNLIDDKGESYTLYTLSGAPRSAFEKFPMPRNTAIFEPTFRGQGPIRSADILVDPRYGKSAPYHGMPSGHLPVRSYLAVPVVSRNGDVLGGLFFGHPQPGMFNERAERILVGLAGQAAVAIDNVREVAARRKAEEELQQLNRELERRVEERGRQLAASRIELEESERRFRLLVEGVRGYAIYMLDPAGVVVNWNPGARQIKGYAAEEVVGRHFSLFYTEADREAGVPARAIDTAARVGKYESEGWRIRKDGTSFWAGVVISAIRGADGAVIGFAKVTRDLTEERAAEERARQSQKMEGIGQLTGGVAHDFNNLLTIIIGNLEAMQRHLGEGTSDRERLARSVDNAMRGARRAESLTQRLLAFSRQTPLEPKPVDLGRLVTGMSDLLRRTLGEQVVVETVLTGGVWRAHADPNQLEVAIVNLAVNARDAMPGGGRLTIETANIHLDEQYAATQAEVVPGQYVMLAVTDSGIGMTSEVKARAFDPFFTTKDVGHGTGLGLSQVYGFVKQSRGHVKIYSEVGEGTTIKIYLPRDHAEAAEDDEAPAPRVARGSRHEVILVVEDDADVRSYSSETLRELGYEVVEAPHARAALHLLEGRPEVALLFTDIGLPGGMNGRQLAEAARARRPNLKVLFTTGYARNAIVHDGRLDPGVELLPKPFTQAALAAKLRDILDARTKPARILLVEDEALIQIIAKEYLEEVGLKVDTAYSAADALNKIQLVPGGVDAVILDMGLPDRRGDVLFKELRALYPTVPIVIASGQGQSGLRRAFEGVSGIAFVDKPYAPEALRAAIRALGIRC